MKLKLVWCWDDGNITDWTWRASSDVAEWAQFTMNIEPRGFKGAGKICDYGKCGVVNAIYKWCVSYKGRSYTWEFPAIKIQGFAGGDSQASNFFYPDGESC